MGGRNRTTGIRGELLAAEFLLENGIEILDRNYRFERAEIDLVCRERGVLVFVEVKSRSSSRFGDPEESVTEVKQRQMQKAAEGYCQKFLLDDKFYRFDIVAILHDRGITTIRHIRDAF